MQLGRAASAQPATIVADAAIAVTATAITAITAAAATTHPAAHAQRPHQGHQPPHWYSTTLCAPAFFGERARPPHLAPCRSRRLVHSSGSVTSIRSSTTRSTTCMVVTLKAMAGRAPVTMASRASTHLAAVIAAEWGKGGEVVGGTAGKWGGGMWLWSGDGCEGCQKVVGVAEDPPGQRAAAAGAAGDGREQEQKWNSPGGGGGAPAVDGAAAARAAASALQSGCLLAGPAAAAAAGHACTGDLAPLGRLEHQEGVRGHMPPQLAHPARQE
eukprot:1161499-Pelagomonas_calceolata.AAC.4